jgi:uncharacterized protein DUF4190/uncharacterized protein DUF1707
MTVDRGSGAVPDPAQTPPLAPLAGTADRERALDVLKAGFAEGRLTLTELDERVALVRAARTYGELASLLADLPAGPSGAVVYCPAGGHPPAGVPAPRVVNSLAVASLVCGLAELPTLGLTALPAVVLGIRARQQIRETGQRGEGLAVAGLVLGWIAISLFFGAVLTVIIWLLLPAGPGTSGPIGS